MIILVKPTIAFFVLRKKKDITIDEDEDDNEESNSDGVTTRVTQNPLRQNHGDLDSILAAI